MNLEAEEEQTDFVAGKELTDLVVGKEPTNLVADRPGGRGGAK